MNKQDYKVILSCKTLLNVDVRAEIHQALLSQLLLFLEVYIVQLPVQKLG